MANMTNHKKGGNKVLLGTLILGVLVAGAAIFSNQSDLFRGQFYFNDSQESQDAAKKIDTTLPENLPSQVTVKRSDNSPANVDLSKADAKPLIAVFEITPNPESDTIFEPSRLVLNIAGQDVRTQNTEARVYFAHKPNCTEIEKSFCDFPPEPETIFTPANIIENPSAPNDFLIELNSASPWKVDPKDWRYEEYGNTYYLAIYTEAEIGDTSDPKNLLTSIKYLGNPNAQFGITGLPTEYQVTDLY